LFARWSYPLALGLYLTLGSSPARASDSGDELVRQARVHEAAREDDVAARRYTEALEVDPFNEDAWLGLGALRVRMGEAREAERVFEAALKRVPTLHRAIAGRARARWAMRRHADAEADMASYAFDAGDADALHELDGWYASDGRLPGQLAVWRKLLVLAADEATQKEARRMVRALVVLVDAADPASNPAATDGTRRALATIARRAGGTIALP
jgi:tetratricopeptide (TPR) repeat protein